MLRPTSRVLTQRRGRPWASFIITTRERRKPSATNTSGESHSASGPGITSSLLGIAVRSNDRDEGSIPRALLVRRGPGNHAVTPIRLAGPVTITRVDIWRTLIG